jgi:hypothetical protein
VRRQRDGVFNNLAWPVYAGSLEYDFLRINVKFRENGADAPFVLCMNSSMQGMVLRCCYEGPRTVYGSNVRSH